MKYLIAWEHATTGRVSKARVSFALKELAEDTARTLSRLRPEREYWVESEDEAAEKGIGVKAQRRGSVEGVYVAGASKPESDSPEARPAPKPPAFRQAGLGWPALPAARPDRLAADQQV